MRICSLLPGATEIAFALGLGDSIVGVTHECDFPPAAKNKTVLVQSPIASGALTSREIDQQVSERLSSDGALYKLDLNALRAARPDVIITQGLCEVCALDYNDVVRAAESLQKQPVIVSLKPYCLADVLNDISRIGAVTQRAKQAGLLVGELKNRIEAVRLRAGQALSRPRTVCLEWFAPLYAAGHWVPEMVQIAGGIDTLAPIGQPSAKLEWRHIRRADPDVIVLMPCGFDVVRTVLESAALKDFDGWSDLAAVKNGNIYAVDASAYFSRPGPRLVDGLEILASIIHPECFPTPISLPAAKRVSL